MQYISSVPGSETSKEGFTVALKSQSSLSLCTLYLESKYVTNNSEAQRAWKHSNHLNVQKATHAAKTTD